VAALAPALNCTASPTVGGRNPPVPVSIAGTGTDSEGNPIPVFRNKIAVGVAAVALVAAGIAAAGYANATAKAGPNVCRAKSDDSLHARSACQPGEVPFALAKGAKGDTGPQGPAGVDGDNTLKISRATVTLNADFTNTGTDAGILNAPDGYVCKYLTITGAPASATNVTELEFDNASTDEVVDTDVLVRTPTGVSLTYPLGTSNGITTPGATTRKFQVCGSGFTGTKTFTASVAVLSIVG